MHLFAAATMGGGIRLFDKIAVVDFGEGHTLVVYRDDLARIKAHAETESASLIRARDMRHFAEMFEIRVARPGCPLGTSGDPEDLVRIAQAMVASGLDYNTWNFPKVVKLVMRQKALQRMTATAA